MSDLPSSTTLAGIGIPAPRALIAEDEPLMRERLLGLLASTWPELEVVAVCEHGPVAWERYLALRPEVAFLDIRLPGLSGLDLAARIGEQAHVVFVTAYDEHAVDAFRRGAIDYLLKPVQAERLAETVARLRRALSLREPPAPLASTLAELQVQQSALPRRPLKWIKASLGKQVKLLAVDEVLYFQADAKYTRVVLAGEEAVIRTPIKDLLTELDPEQFWQIHRSTVVAVRAIASLYREEAERQFVLLRGRPERLAVSRAFYHLFKEA
jgi:DNA-binding LytR/AlgR family response regulator